MLESDQIPLIYEKQKIPIVINRDFFRFSITVDKDIYPVAYLIIEDNSMMKENRYFVSPPQTMFAMEGQTAILSCQLVSFNIYSPKFNIPR